MMTHIIERIKEYLVAKEPMGAFQIRGEWGSGKTYFFKNILPKEIKDETTDNPQIKRIPVMISLFGIGSVRDIPYRLLNAYVNKLRNLNRDITESMNRGLDYIDIKYGSSKRMLDIDLQDEDELIYNIIPHDNVYLCFDDMERFINPDNVEELMGLINNLVENLRYKVFVICNDHYQYKDSKANAVFTAFKEKVIFSSVNYKAELRSVYDSIVDGYENMDFSMFMKNEEQYKFFDPNCHNKILKKYFANIRNMKFALKTLYDVFCYYKDEIENEATIKKLRYLTAFIVGVSIEYKRNLLTDKNCRQIDVYTDIINVDLGDDEEVDVLRLFDDVEETSEEKERREKEDKFNRIYSKRFYKDYLKDFGLKVIFFKSLYDNVVNGTPIDYQEIEEKYNGEILSKETKENVGNKIVEQILDNTFLDYSDEEGKAKMLDLQKSVDESTLNQCTAYINAFSFLDMYKTVIGISHNELVERFKKGIDGYLRRAEISSYERSGIEMVKDSIGKDSMEIYEYLLEKLDAKDEDEQNKGIEKMIELFKTSIEKFCGLFGYQNNNGGLRTATSAVLQNIPQSVVEQRMQTINAKDVHLLALLISQRYTPQDIYSYHLKEEASFLSAMQHGIESMEGDDTLTKVEAKTVLMFHIKKAFRYIEVAK